MEIWCIFYSSGINSQYYPGFIATQTNADSLSPSHILHLFCGLICQNEGDGLRNGVKREKEKGAVDREGDTHNN